MSELDIDPDGRYRGGGDGSDQAIGHRGHAFDSELRPPERQVVEGDGNGVLLRDLHLLGRGR